MSTESEFYRGAVPTLVNERLVYNAVIAVSASHEDSKRWPGFGLDTVPDLRRFNLHTLLMLATWTPGVSAYKVPHQGGAHVEVRGSGYAISCVTRSSMPSKVEPHSYRKTLAKDGQLSLPAVDEVEELEECEDFLYGLLIFGGHFKAPFPRFCRMTFPTEDGILAPGTIDLLSEYNYVVEPFRDEEHRTRETARFIEMRESAFGF